MLHRTATLLAAAAAPTRTHLPTHTATARRTFAAASADTPMRVAFIGLGNMGLHMASNLVKAGFHVTGFDLSDKAVHALEAVGGYAASGVKEMAARADATITMLPSSPHVQEVYTGENGILSGASPSAVLLDASTIEPAVARAVNAAAKASGVSGGVSDVPVSGGVGGAAAGTLTFMAGGDADAIARAQPLLDVMGGRTVHCGESGAGQVAKVCNNLVLGISMIGVCEAMNLGRKLGMDPHVMAGIFNTSTARCWSSDTYNPVPGVMEGVPASRDYEGGFGVDLMAKDLSLAVAAAHQAKAPLPLGGSTLQVYNMLSEAGYGRKDFGSVYKFLQGKKPDDKM
eukprot:TRINITY_DN3659_c0_g1_i1.p1 TRINITY_DN3659_c0_g1~~TRINITY_DN3659_c0_g1_i1.p1  ORF type:complete len:387 (-),score=112.11 TRINITY_DN3659_c0_g1_i1:167-1192(-)